MKKLFLILNIIILVSLLGCGTTPVNPTYLSGKDLVPNQALTLIGPDTGIYPDITVLSDGDNKYTDFLITGDWNTFKWDVQDLPIQYAHEKFYLWATFLTKEAWGEPQYYVGKALGELCENGLGDPVITNQAIKAYQRVLDLFFHDLTLSVTGKIEKLNVLSFEAIVALGGNPKGVQMIIVDYTNKYVFKTSE